MIIDLTVLNRWVLVLTEFVFRKRLGIYCGSVQSAMANGYATGRTREDIHTICDNVRSGVFSSSQYSVMCDRVLERCE